MSHVRTLVAGAWVALALTAVGCAADPEDNGGNMFAAGVGGAGGAAGVGTAGASGAGGVVGHDMPCAVETVVAAKCQNCHGATPQFGAPMSLITTADFQRDYPVATTTQLAGRTLKMYELARIRLNREMGTALMPQGPPLAANDLGTLNTWLMQGAPAGTKCGTGTAGDVAPPTGGVGGVVPTGGAGGVGAAGAGAVGAGEGGMGGTGPDDPTMIEDQCLREGAFEPLVAKEPGEICYDFLVHGNFGEDDTSKFNVPIDESYNQFYYSVPWPAGYVATRFGQKFDNKAVLHHWLMFSQQAGMAPGTVEPNVLGTTLFTDAELVAGWAVGGCTTTYPANVGVHLPSSGVIMIQWHHYNNTGLPAQDGTSVQICAVPEAMREHKAGLTFLGTETMSVPAGMEAKAGGTCINDSGAPITILGFTPHMHTIGIHMQSEVTRAAGGAVENVFDMPFQFDYQTNYMLKEPGVILQPGDAITSTCTYQNNGVSTVNFGQSTKAEMCYQFALAYPYGALNNGVLSLIGATNTCW